MYCFIEKFYRFPMKNLFLLERWMENLPLKDWKPNKDSLLCSNHFTDDCFDRSGFRVQLKSDSIPT